MPNKHAAEKALRKTKKHKERNDLVKRHVDFLIRKTRKAFGEKQKDAATTWFAQALRALDRAAQKGVLKKNTASRLKARLAHAAHARAS